MTLFLTTKMSSMEEQEPQVKGRKDGVLRFFLKYVPILRWLPKYTRLDAVSDLVAGITLGLTMIPQSIAYAALAGLTAQYGLYSSFLGGFLYVIFGTIKEVSIGPTSLMSLLTLEYTRGMPVEFIILLTFLAGCIELMMGLLNLGFLVDFISMPVASGFTSATSVIIIISQLQGMFGLKYKSPNIVDNVYKLFQNITDLRYADVVLGLCTIAFLLFFRRLKDVKCSGPKKKFLWFLSIGRNALAVLIASIIAFHLDSEKEPAPFILSGKVESGLPRVALPPFSTQIGNQTYSFLNMCSHYSSGIFVVPLIAVLANVAIAKAFASGETVEASQEMRTLGLCNILGSFVSSMPTCGAFTRSAVSSASGVQTPMAGLYSGMMTLFALSFLTPYFYYIPRSTLSAILITAVIFMIDWKIVKLLWKGCRKDMFTTVSTFLVCVICSVEIGLLLGAIFSLAFLLRPTARPTITVEENETELGNGYLMIKPDITVCYPGVTYFCHKVLDIARKWAERSDTPIVLNCEAFSYLDYTAAKGFERLFREINKEKGRFWLMNLRPEITDCLMTFVDQKYVQIIHCQENIDVIFEDVATCSGSTCVKINGKERQAYKNGGTGNVSTGEFHKLLEHGSKEDVKDIELKSLPHSTKKP